MSFDPTYGPFNLPDDILLTNNNLSVQRLEEAFGLKSVVGIKWRVNPSKRYYELRFDVTRTSGVNRARKAAIAFCNPTVGPTSPGQPDPYYNIYSNRIGYNALTQLAAGLESQATNASAIIRTSLNPDPLPTDPQYNQGDFRTSTLPSVGQGDFIQIAVDVDRIWCGVNDVWDGDPSLGTGGDLHGCGQLLAPLYQTGDDPNQITARFTPPFEGTIPTGFTGWQEQVLLKTPALHVDYMISNAAPDPLLDPIGAIPQGTYYRGRITGEGNAVEDVELPISSFTLSLRAGADDNLSMVIPNGQLYAEILNQRGNGQLYVEQFIRYNDGTISNVRQVGWCEYDNIRLDLGATTASITLSGGKNVPYRTARVYTPEGVSFRSNANGIRSFRAKVDPDVKPGDTADLDDEAWIIGSVTITASPSQGDRMDISED